MMNLKRRRILGRSISSAHADDSGSLSSLTISGNSIGSAQEAMIKQICADKSIQCTL
jgi:hypothetical protein